MNATSERFVYLIRIETHETYKSLFWAMTTFVHTRLVALQLLHVRACAPVGGACGRSRFPQPPAQQHADHIATWVAHVNKTTSFHIATMLFAYVWRNPVCNACKIAWRLFPATVLLAACRLLYQCLQIKLAGHTSNHFMRVKPLNSDSQQTTTHFDPDLVSAIAKMD